MVGDGLPPHSRRPETAKPKSLLTATPVPIKQLVWDEDNVIYELDDPPVFEAEDGDQETALVPAQARNKPTRPKSGKPSAPIRQPQMNQKLNRPAQNREVYKSQNCMDGDYERAKKAELDENLVLAGNQKALTFGHQTMGAFNAKQTRRLKVDMKGKKD